VIPVDREILHTPVDEGIVDSPVDASGEAAATRAVAVAEDDEDIDMESGSSVSVVDGDGDNALVNALGEAVAPPAAVRMPSDELAARGLARDKERIEGGIPGLYVDCGDNRARHCIQAVLLTKKNNDLQTFLASGQADQPFLVELFDNKGRPTAQVNLFTDWKDDRLNPTVVLKHCNALSDDQDLSCTYNTVLNSCDDSMRNRVEAKMANYRLHGKVGPLAFYFLMQEIGTCSEDTRLGYLREMYELELSGFAGEDVLSHSDAFLCIHVFLESHDVDLSEARLKILGQYQRSSVSKFRDHFSMLESVNDPKVRDVRATIREGRAMFTELKHLQQWSTSSATTATTPTPEQADAPGDSDDSATTATTPTPTPEQADAPDDSDDGGGQPAVSASEPPPPPPREDESRYGAGAESGDAGRAGSGGTESGAVAESVSGSGGTEDTAAGTNGGVSEEVRIETSNQLESDVAEEIGVGIEVAPPAAAAGMPEEAADAEDDAQYAALLQATEYNLTIDGESAGLPSGSHVAPLSDEDAQIAEAAAALDQFGINQPWEAQAVVEQFNNSAFSKGKFTNAGFQSLVAVTTSNALTYLTGILYSFGTATGIQLVSKACFDKKLQESTELQQTYTMSMVSKMIEYVSPDTPPERKEELRHQRGMPSRSSLQRLNPTPIPRNNSRLLVWVNKTEQYANVLPIDGDAFLFIVNRLNDVQRCTPKEDWATISTKQRLSSKAFDPNFLVMPAHFQLAMTKIGTPKLPPPDTANANNNGGIARLPGTPAPPRGAGSSLIPFGFPVGGAGDAARLLAEFSHSMALSQHAPPPKLEINLTQNIKNEFDNCGTVHTGTVNNADHSDRLEQIARVSNAKNSFIFVCFEDICSLHRPSFHTLD